MTGSHGAWRVGPVRLSMSGGRDQVSIEIAARWSDVLGDALRTGKALAAVYSPVAIESEYCGREWAAFRSRHEERMAAGDKLNHVRPSTVSSTGGSWGRANAPYPRG